MLILSRSEGQSIVFGDYKLLVTKVRSNLVTFTLTYDSKQTIHTLKHNEKLKLQGNISIMATRLLNNRVRLGFNVPPEIEILRSELIKREN
jgi:sRNA-binding carbon storage regulator CsrA